MKPILAKDIIVDENRQRTSFDEKALVELSESIQRNSLLHPVICREKDGALHLVAGERRLRAIRMLIDLDIPVICNQTAYTGGTIPVTLLSELSEEAAFEAELEENIRRVDLSWQERAAATQRLHDFRAAHKPAGEKQTIVATAAEALGTTPTSNDVAIVKDDLLVAKHLHDPDVRKAASKKEALKLIEKKAKAEHRARLAEQFDLTKSKHTLHKGDLFDVLPTLETGSFDCLCTDPPYGVDASDFGSNFNVAHNYTDDWEYFTHIAHFLPAQAARVLKASAHAYVFCSFDGFLLLKNTFTAAGFRVWPQPLIWAKGNGNAPWINEGHKRTYECILFASRGNRPVNVVKNDVIAISPVADREHAAEKPVELLVDLLSRSTLPGDNILDVCCGSGTIFPAASAVNCRATGIEKLDEHFNVALTRLELIL